MSREQHMNFFSSVFLPEASQKLPFLREIYCSYGTKTRQCLRNRKRVNNKGVYLYLTEDFFRDFSTMRLRRVTASLYLRMSCFIRAVHIFFKRCNLYNVYNVGLVMGQFENFLIYEGYEIVCMCCTVLWKPTRDMFIQQINIELFFWLTLSNFLLCF